MAPSKNILCAWSISLLIKLPILCSNYLMTNAIIEEDIIHLVHSCMPGLLYPLKWMLELALFTVSVKTPSYTREMAQCTQRKPWLSHVSGIWNLLLKAEHTRRESGMMLMQNSYRIEPAESCKNLHQPIWWQWWLPHQTWGSHCQDWFLWTQRPKIVLKHRLPEMRFSGFSACLFRKQLLPICNPNTFQYMCMVCC